MHEANSKKRNSNSRLLAALLGLHDGTWFPATAGDVGGNPKSTHPRPAIPSRDDRVQGTEIALVSAFVEGASRHDPCEQSVHERTVFLVPSARCGVVVRVRFCA